MSDFGSPYVNSGSGTGRADPKNDELLRQSMTEFFVISKKCMFIITCCRWNAYLERGH